MTYKFAALRACPPPGILYLCVRRGSLLGSSCGILREMLRELPSSAPNHVDLLKKEGGSIVKTTALKIVKKAGRALLADVIGGALYAAGVYSFASAAEFAPGGIAGLAVILNHFTDLPIGLCTLAFNVPVILLCFKTLGRTFFLRSLCTMAVSTILMDFVFPLLPVYHGDALMAALFAGALSGAGLALIYAQDSSTLSLIHISVVVPNFAVPFIIGDSEQKCRR